MLVMWIVYSLLPNGQQLVQAEYIRMEIESQDWIQASFPPEKYLEFPLWNSRFDPNLLIMGILIISSTGTSLLPDYLTLPMKTLLLDS